jgi:ActR/RegA family two-component response regulator
VVARGQRLVTLVQDLHPDALCLVVAGSRDVEVVMDAINRGAIHRYYADPWDVDVLQADVRDAFRRYWLLHDGSDEGPAAAPAAPSPRSGTTARPALLHVMV